MNIAQLVKKAEKFTINNSPLILTAIGVTGTISTAVLTGKASYKAGDVLRYEEEMRQRRAHHHVAPGEVLPPMTKKEQAQLVWELYIPAAGVGVMTITCIVMANRIGTRRAAAMAAAYSISEKAFGDYREKVVEQIGKNKEQKVRDEIAQDRVRNNPRGGTEMIVAGSGDVWFYDMEIGRYFQSTMEQVKKAMNDLNYTIIHHNYASLNDFYDKLGLAHTNHGEEVGWTSDHLMDIEFSTTMMDDSVPCIAINFAVTPVRDYFRSR